MDSKIQALSGFRNIESPGIQTENKLSQSTNATEVGGGENFGDALSKAIEDVNTKQVQADQAVQELISGKSKNIHETMLAVERADLSLKMMMQVRNKVIDAYREVMKMQV